MNMKVALYCGESLGEFEIPMDDVAMYTLLVKEYGYMDMDGNIYSFESAQVDGLEFCIYLVKKDD